MALTPGTRLGPYEVTAQIGAGGMGEVYKATDTNLKRQVAIKVLPASVAGDAERLARFQREAEVLAALNHSNIAQIHGLEKSNGTIALVMELVEGPTLADRIAQGAIPIDEALPIAKQVADALEAAHEQGIIHRDLKPANIKVRSDGTVKVLDFGLAKAMEPVGAMSVSNSMSPTITTPAMTQAGMILGTAAYMAPEQARGRTADKRADIWAFGAVLFEMLTGQRAFPGEDLTDTLAAVVKLDPKWDAVGADVPARVRQVLRVCLQKDPRQRAQAIGDVRLALEGAFETAVPQTQDGVQPHWPALGRWTVTLGIAAAVLLVATIGGAVSWMAFGTAPATVPRVARLTMVLPAGEELANLGNPAVAISPTGTHVSYIATSGGRQQLYLRAIDGSETKLLAGTDQAANSFFSPDGQWIGFFAQGKLKKVSISAGAIQTLCDAPDGRGGTWAPDGSIYFAGSNTGGLSKVSASGGTPTTATTLDRAKGEVSHRWPQVLPGGSAVMFTIWTGPGRDERYVQVQRLATGERSVVVQGGETGFYVPTGHVVYARADELFAMPFNLERLQVSGQAVRLADVVRGSAGAEGAHFAVSDTGTLVHLPGDPQRYERRLVWVGRDGRVEPLSAPPREYNGNAVISPDGRQAAVDVESGTIGIWLYDFARATLTPLTTGTGSSQAPRWTADGKRIVYRGTRSGLRSLWWKTVDDTTSEERLTTDENQETPGSWSADGQWLVYNAINPATAGDVWALPASGNRKPRVIVGTSFIEVHPRLSPDGRWLAYTSNEPGRVEVFVQPFLGPGGRSQISNDGGAEPVWSRDGRELFYLNGDKMMTVEITTAPAFRAGSPRLLFEGRYMPSPNAVAAFDVAADGQRFLRVQPMHPDPPANQIHVVLNWFEELKRLVPTN